MKRYFIDGCFDGYHYGHVNAIFQSKQLADTLVCATHSDTEMITHKNKPLFPYNERHYMLKHCKFIDKLEEDVPYITKYETVLKYNCTAYLHGKEDIYTKNNTPAIDINIINNNYITYEVTKGISTSNLLLRLYNYYNNFGVTTNNDIEYLTEIFNKVNQFSHNKSLKTNKNLYLFHSWDLFCSVHVEHIKKIKEKYCSYRIILCFNEDNVNNEIYIYNKLERAIIMASINIIDGVLLDKTINPMNSDEEFIDLSDENSIFHLIFDKKEFVYNIMKNINDYQQKLDKILNSINKK
jgi:ethanolamine-phosphate cytidylyltransferase